jgi:hypothetical protein
MNVRHPGSSQSERHEQEARYSSRDVIEAISPTGNITFVQQPLKFARTEKRNGIVHSSHDTAAPRPGAQADPTYSQMVAALNLRLRLEFDALGRAIELKIDNLDAINKAHGSHVRQFMEQKLAEGLNQLPESPVDVGNTWNNGLRQSNMFGIGVLTVEETAQVERIDTVDGERIAFIVAKGINARFTPDGHLAGQLKFLGAEYIARIEFSITGGYQRYKEATTRVKAQVHESGRIIEFDVSLLLQSRVRAQSKAAPADGSKSRP